MKGILKIFPFPHVHANTSTCAWVYMNTNVFYNFYPLSNYVLLLKSESIIMQIIILIDEWETIQLIKYVKAADLAVTRGDILSF
jgi:hypothetical protein